MEIDFDPLHLLIDGRQTRKWFLAFNSRNGGLNEHFFANRTNADGKKIHTDENIKNEANAKKVESLFLSIPTNRLGFELSAIWIIFDLCVRHDGGWNI